MPEASRGLTPLAEQLAAAADVSRVRVDGMQRCALRGCSLLLGVRLAAAELVCEGAEVGAGQGVEGPVDAGLPVAVQLDRPRAGQRVQELEGAVGSDCSADDFDSIFDQPVRAKKKVSAARAACGAIRSAASGKPGERRRDSGAEKRSLLTDVDVLVS